MEEFEEDKGDNEFNSTIFSNNLVSFDELVSNEIEFNPFSSTDISSTLTNPADWKIPDITVYADARIKGIRSKKSRKRKISGLIEYKFHHIPRIIKSDVRRQYGVMFTNVYNSGDFEYMRQFCGTFCSKITGLTLIRKEFGERKKEHSGFKDCGGLWYDAMNEAPDVVCTLTSNQFKLRSDGTGVNSGTFKLTGTKPIMIDREDLQFLRNLIANKPQYQLLLEDDSFEEVHYPSEDTLNADNASISSISANSSPSDQLDMDNIHRDPSSLVADQHESDNPLEVYSLPSPHEISELALLIEERRQRRDIESSKGSVNRNLITVPVAFELNGLVSLHLDADSMIYYFDIVIG